MGVDDTLRGNARQKMMDACAEYLDTYEGCEGGLITGWVVAVEFIRPGDEGNRVVWASGNGDTANDFKTDGGGLGAHRLYGLIHYVEMDVDSYMFRNRVRFKDGEDED